MFVIPGIFKDNTFIPEEPFNLPDGTKGQLSVDEQSAGETKMAEESRLAFRQLAAVEAFVAGIETIDRELPPEFDMEIAKGLQFRQVDFS